MTQTGPAAVLDLGTNSTRMLCVESPGPRMDPDSIRAHETIITRLGEGVDEHGRIDPDARDRVLGAVRRFQERLDELGGHWVGGLATSACRRASGESVGDLLESVRQITGFTPRVVSGEREAELTYRGVRASLEGFRSGVVLDIGGGSSEWICSSGPDEFEVESLPIGVVTLFERCGRGDRWGNESEECVAGQLEKTFHPRHPGSGPLVVVGGTGTTLAALRLDLREYDPRRVHGYTLREEDVRALLDSLRDRPYAELAEVPVIQEGREEVILPGVHILLHAMEYRGVHEVRVSEFGVLAGLLGEEVPS